MSSPNQTESNNAAEASPAERRRNLRFPFSAAVEVVETKSGTQLIGRTSDLGLGGCYIDTLSPLPVGTEAKVRILRDNESFEAQARVVYSSIGMGMGLAFVSAQPKQIRIFQRWLQEFSGQSVPAPDVPTEDDPETPPSEKTQSLLRNAVLSDLIMTLMQKNVLTDREGRDLLRKLFV
jgi:PilZ domain-containing protein